MLNLLSRLRGLRPALTRRAFWLWVALITLLRCAVTHFQLAYMWAGGAPLDDELMFRAANAITSGQWLGEYDYLTLSKSMFFAVWLALLNKLHLPYLLGGALLWCAAALLAAFALRPLWRKSPAGPGRALTLLLYAPLAFLPVFFRRWGGGGAGGCFLPPPAGTHLAVAAGSGRWPCLRLPEP